MRIPFPHDDIVAVVRLVEVVEVKANGLINYLNIDLLLIIKVAVFHDRVVIYHFSQLLSLGVPKSHVVKSQKRLIVALLLIYLIYYSCFEL